GWVLNGAMGVAMEIQGDAVACGEFQRRLVAQPPPLARIDDLQITEIDVANDHGFIIRQSATGQRKTLISPDMATCDECLADLNDPHSRMYGYPFVNCTNCGPRFTIIEDIPYDRAKTTMRDFALCVPCRKDFTDPRNRRFHAQPIACPACGPRLDFFYNQDGGQVTDPIRSTQEALLAGKIVAVKGLGGYHLACDAQNESAVA
ncbi:MAG: Sua5/YciO/YrdC/YwlC family protein, partial [Clostridiales bacterium]